LTLGEAGVALLLMSEECANRQAEAPLAYVAGWGAANDAHHVTAPARDGCVLILSCQQALEKAKIGATQIAAINTHGTGTIYNDAMELTAFNDIFGESLPPLHGVKGSLGHCLGAAGGVEIAIGCRSLQQQLIPGTVGCLDAEVAGQGQLSPLPQEISGSYLLCSNSGFGCDCIHTNPQSKHLTARKGKAPHLLFVFDTFDWQRMQECILFKYPGGVLK